jgi:hypothetical protein
MNANSHPITQHPALKPFGLDILAGAVIESVDLWGTLWTAEEVNSPDFGLPPAPPDASEIRIAVYYSCGEPDLPEPDHVVS